VERIVDGTDQAPSGVCEQRDNDDEQEEPSHRVLTQRRERPALIGAARIEANRQPQRKDAHGAVDDSAHNIAETGCALRPRTGDDLLGATLHRAGSGMCGGLAPATATAGGDHGLVGHAGTITRSAPGTDSTITGVRPMRSLSATTAVLGLVVIVRELN
jgi:hypothetical protein